MSHTAPPLVTPHAGVWIETVCAVQRGERREVTPHAGVWIETLRQCAHSTPSAVTPHAGVWIETFTALIISAIPLSLPMRECGLKHAETVVYSFEASHSPCGSVD